MELIRDDHKELELYWLSKKPKTIQELGLAALIDFSTKIIRLVEIGIERKEEASVLISFNEFKNLQTIIEDK